MSGLAQLVHSTNFCSVGTYLQTASLNVSSVSFFPMNGINAHSMVSDNASYFTSAVFTQFCRENGIYHKLSAPGHPASNGLAERNVQTVKNCLKALAKESLPMAAKINHFLIQYRATPLADGKSPADKYLGRRFRMKLDRMFQAKPSVKPCRCKIGLRQMKINDRVAARCIVNNQEKWLGGTVLRRLRELHYIIQLDTGRVLKKHIDQLKSTAVQKKKVTYVLPEEVGRESQAAHREEQGLTDLQLRLSTAEQKLPPAMENPIAVQPQALLRTERQHRRPEYLRDYRT